VVSENLSINLITANLLLNNTIEMLNSISMPGDEQINVFLKQQEKALPGIRTILITDARGRARFSNRDEIIGRDFSSREYFKAPLAAEDRRLMIISPPFISLLGVYVINVTRALVRVEGDFQGVVTATLEPAYFLTLLNSVLSAPDSRVCLVHANDTLFLSVPDPLMQLGESSVRPETRFLRHMHGGNLVSVQRGISEVTGDERIFAMISNRPLNL
jgi:hypothetical protein